MDNREFLAFMFRGTPHDEAPLLCSFRTDPLRMPKWHAFPLAESTRWDALDNNFVTLSSFSPLPGGGYRCKAAQFAELRFVMLDDVAQDAVGALPELEPTYAVETSPRNFQFGYALRQEPELRSRPFASQFLHEIGRRVGNLGGINVTRWARLPVGTNTKAKYGPAGHRHRLVDFRPVRHGWREVAQAFGTSIASLETMRARIELPMMTYAALDHVVPALRRFGLYNRDLGNGRHAIVCPNREEHTGGEQGQSDTVYFEPSVENSGRGGVKCLHSHCAHVDLPLILAVIDALEQLPTATAVIGDNGDEQKS